MKRVTVSLEQRHVYELEARQRIDDLSSRSKAARATIESYEELKQEYEDLHKSYEELEQEYEDLHKKYEEREDRIETLESQIDEKIEDLPEKVRSVETYTERRQRLLDSASLLTRLRWKVTGVPVDRLEGDSD